MSTDPGVDELLARHHLRDLGVGHNPTGVEDDWWTALYLDGQTPAAAGPNAPAEPPGRIRKLSGLIPDWRKGPVADLRGHRPDRADTAPDTTTPDALGVEPEQDDEAPGEEWEEAEPADESTPQAVRRGRQRQQIHTAYTGLNRRTRWLIRDGSAAATGWYFGLESVFNGWIVDCQHDTGSTTALIVGCGMVTIGAFVVYRTAGWWPPLAWVCRIPFSSALLALALYAPGATP